MFGAKIIIFVGLIASLSLASAYTTEQQASIDGVKLAFQMGQATGAHDIPAYNALAPAWNAWVRANFGEDANLLASPLTDLSKPFMIANNTTQTGVVHTIDGSGKYGPHYTTNDINVLPDAAIAAHHGTEAGRLQGDGYLGGI